MPFDFDPNGKEADVMDGFDDGTEPYVEAEDDAPVPGTPAGYISNAAVEQLLSAEPQEEDYEKVLSQVDRRMRVAHFYQSILGAALFSDETSEAVIVQNRIRKFCKDELETIFGMRSALPSGGGGGGQFSDDEVKFLKDLIAGLIASKEAKAKQSPKPPSVNKIQTKPAQALRPVQTQAQPSVPRQLPAPLPKPPPQAQASKPKPPAGKVDMRIPERYRDDPTAKVIKGKVYVQARGDDKEPLWRTVDAKTGDPLKNPVAIMRDVTPTAVPTGSSIQPIPMPSVSAFSQIMQQHADTTLQMIDQASSRPGMGGNIARQFGGAIAISLLNKSGEEDEYER